MTEFPAQRSPRRSAPIRSTRRPPGRPGLDPLPLLEAGDGVVWVPDWPGRAGALARLAKTGRLVRLKRGLYVAPGAERQIETLVRAVQKAHPDAIFTGAVAAWLHGWTDITVHEVTAIHTGESAAFGMVRLTRGKLADSVWTEVNGVRILTPAMTALDLVPQVGADLIDDLMRRSRRPRQTMSELAAALAATPGRIGNQLRHRLIARTTTRPFSAAERLLHDLLDLAGLTGWIANQPHRIRGKTVLPDIVFEAARLIIEVDGRAFHDRDPQFESDRRRQNQLVLDGWRVLRYTWAQLTTIPEVVIAEIKEALWLPLNT